MRSLEDLLELQGLDSSIDRLLDRRSHLPQLAAFRAAHQRLERLDAEITAAAATRRELELSEDRAEGEMKLDEAKVQREEQRLFAGVGLTAKDLTHLRDEVAQLRERISRREDEALALIDQQQAAAARLAGLEAERRVTLADKERLEAEIAAEWKAIDAELGRLEARKRETVPLVDPELLDLYEEIRPIKEGVAAAALTDGTCGGCHLKLTAAEEIQVRREHPPRCLHCRRILVTR
ncbi:MAG: hypothetical protein HZA58_07935 [Acidimicrobiia bacterium]|nr:hypothetical protein [Acidimicrobiia bacterium]